MDGNEAVREVRQGWLDRARGGDPRALGLLMEAYRPWLKAIARCEGLPAGRGEGSSSDLAQETCVEVMRDLSRFQGREIPEFEAWLRGVLRHLVANGRRRAGTKRRGGDRGQAFPDWSRLIEFLAALPGREESPSAQVSKRERAERVRGALDRLPPEIRRVLALFYLEMRTEARIAEDLGLTETTVRSRRLGGLKRLRTMLSPP